MNFYDEQQKNKRNTLLLLTLFFISIGVIAIIIYFLSIPYYQPDDGLETIWHFNLDLILLVFFGVLLGIGVPSVVKVILLQQGGGRAVAEKLGGILLRENTKNLKEQMLYNVVTEMAIASGIKTPPIYILYDESAINAFAAGYNQNDAVIGITQGALDHFNREELQAVIAHEFSHIFNGDMRLNMRILGVLFGLTCLYFLGRIILRGSLRSSNKKGGQIMLIAFALVILGLLGVFIGKIIKAAVSRQREYLADASAVQFTRNPNGLKNALIKIKKIGSEVENDHAEEARHFFFGSAGGSMWAGLFSTHPPINKRIARLR